MSTDVIFSPELMKVTSVIHIREVNKLMTYEDYLLDYSDTIAEQIFDELTRGKDEPEFYEIAPLLLFQTMIDKIRAIQVLRDSKSNRVGDSADGIVRTVYECKWNLLYMVEDDSQFRSRAYYYLSRLEEAKSNIEATKYKLSEHYKTLDQIEDDMDKSVKDIFEYEKALKADDADLIKKYHDIYISESENLLPAMKFSVQKTANIVHDGYLWADTMEKDKERHQNTIDYLESDSQFSDIRDAINSLPDKYKKYPKWYNLKSKIGSLTSLAKHLKRSEEFKGLYGEYSQDSHVLNGTKQIVLKDGKATLRRREEVLTIAETEYAFSDALDALSDSLEPFLSHYGRHQEIEEFINELSCLID